MRGLERKVRRGWFSLRHDGVRYTGERALRALGGHLAGTPDLPLDDEYIADSALVDRPERFRVADRPLRLGWVCTPPSPGSGGHTTLFRMVRALEDKGHRCVIFLYDRYRGDLAEQARVIRSSWPDLRAEVRDVRTGLHGVDGLVASGWESAHVVASSGPSDVARFYFVQDYEPLFHAAGFEHALAEDSYRFGFRTISLGGMIAARLGQLGVPSDVVHFGCDASTYRLLPDPVARRGVICYVRPSNPRRGFELARLTLTRFAEEHPEVPIHLYGAHLADVGFQATITPHLAPAELNALYNRSIAGLALSFTNVSLVPEELLRAGAVPVVNECADASAVLGNRHVHWARSTPQALAAALGKVVAQGVSPDRARELSESVHSRWEITEREVTAIIEDELYSSGSDRGST